METLYLKSGSKFTATTKDALDIHDRLPSGTYSIKQTPAGEYYLERIQMLTLPKKLYGTTTRKAERIFNTFLKRPSTTGILLAGTKGSGKTMLAKQVSRMAADSDEKIPTVVINEPLCGESFNEFIQSIEQPLVLIFDEFEKVYEDQADQEAMLTLLDGVYSTKKLFIFTSNDKDSINENMLNRPGRIFYSLSFHGVDEQFIKEYCEDNLNDKSYITLMTRVAQLFSEFNFDMLKSMVEDMNRYDESPIEVLEYLNADPKTSGDQTYSVQLWMKKKKVDLGDDYTWNGNAITEDITIYTDEDTAEFKPQHMKAMNNKGEYIFEKEGGTKMILKPIKKTGINLKALLETEQKEEKASKWFKKSKSSRQ
eukprot:CAMPEP_0117014150 /NCGR_PEP_ID=MMETSP0472-20121206/11534_1 /TAXON_ID=693140 ORGANISM="Tiarina fusus, Strain LIS" /NCGR_SAMPLE_ID=MMETSP0472 /ASSEMBLY_ACC=CAM_ASM_000603 /LENGTH=366 /DNA_ID=CAMNT_0004717639 /DNA_START=72 /DNA_END=1172 /DNA_ORIENTATION=+